MQEEPINARRHKMQEEPQTSEFEDHATKQAQVSQSR
jgi:hypothetical protein